MKGILLHKMYLPDDVGSIDWEDLNVPETRKETARRTRRNEHRFASRARGDGSGSGTPCRDSQGARPSYGNG
jgi:hypothetical protein